MQKSLDTTKYRNLTSSSQRFLYAYVLKQAGECNSKLHTERDLKGRIGNATPPLLVELPVT
jgi:hypothetical protein